MEEFAIDSRELADMQSVIAKLNNHLRARPGRYTITVKRFVKAGTIAQRGYFHAAIVEAYRKFISDQDNPITHDAAHADLKRRFRKRIPVVDLLTGEIVGERQQAGGEMCVGEWCEFIDLGIQFLTEQLGLIVQDPRRWYDEPAKVTT